MRAIARIKVIIRAIARIKNSPYQPPGRCGGTEKNLGHDFFFEIKFFLCELDVKTKIQ